MTTQAETSPQSRSPLSKERVLHTAVALADRDGIEALTMRKLARELEVEAMSLYYHVANKEALLDGIVDVIASEVIEAVAQVEPPADDWKGVMRARILTAREVMLRHPWAPGVFETRTSIAPSLVFYYDAVIGIFRDGGFSYDLAHHSMHALGSRALGFSQELFQPDDVDQGDEEAEEMIAQMADQAPHLVAMIADAQHDEPDTTLGWCDDQTEFEFGLDVILDGLERLNDRS